MAVDTVQNSSVNFDPLVPVLFLQTGLGINLTARESPEK